MTQLLGVSQLEQARISQLSFVTAQENQTPDNTSTPRASILNSVSAQGIPDHAGDTPTRNSIRSFSAARHISYFSEDFSDESALRPSIHDSASSGQTATHIPSSSNTYSNGTEDIEAQSDKEEESTYTDITTPTSTTSPPPSSEIHFRSMTWLQCSALMIAETISLGILALPSVLATIGLIPGLLLILSMGILAWYSGYVMHQFRCAYPTIHSWADCCEILLTPLGWGRIGHEIAGAAQILFLLFLMGSHILTWIICLHTLTGGRVCNIVWGVVGMGIFWILDLPRTCRGMSWMSVVSFASIGTAVLITMISVGIRSPPSKPYTLWPRAHLSLREAFLSITNIVFAYAGHVAFFTFMSELREPDDFPKSLATLQIVEISLYLVSAIVIYVYAGSTVTSPALGSAGPVVSKIAFGVAIPTIVIAGVIFGHVASKYVFNKIFAGSPHINTRTKMSTMSWMGITLLLWIVAWVIAESIPVFNELLGLVSSLFASWFTYGLAGIMWLFVHKGRWNEGWWMRGLFLCNVGLVGVGAVICGMGLWASGVGIGEGAREGKSWSCGRE